jgi:CMP-N-acetylneuraminic acid synthetase
MTRTLAMIPARMGSKRLPKKNLRELDGVPLFARAIRKCQAAGCFDEIWMNSEDAAFGPLAEAEGVKFHQRPFELGGDSATSEDFVTDFLLHHECTHLVQVHSIAPLLTTEEVKSFTEDWLAGGCDVMLSCIHDQIEVAYKDQPVNFTFSEKTNSQDLTPTQRITWSITGWKRDTFLAARAAGKTATYSGKIGFFPVSGISGHVVKTETDLRVAEAIYRQMGLEGLA